MRFIGGDEIIQTIRVSNLFD
jgi:T-complex protein 1 subunit epsilon